MKLCRYNGNHLGVVEGDQVADISQALSHLPKQSYPYPGHDQLVANLDKLKPVIVSLLPSAQRVPLESVRLELPVANPGKIVAAPVNYQKHLNEVRDQVDLHHGNEAHMRQIRDIGLFLKASSSLIGPSDRVVIGKPERRNDHEIELAVVIGRIAKNVPAAEALDYVAGYAVALDMTVRGPEDRSFRKSLDTYSVLGPWLVTADELPDPACLDLELTVNGLTRQKANTRDLVLSVSELIEFASSFYTLHPGDLIFTGTPEGVGPVERGDRIVAEIDGVGSITIDVA
ncbi:fumarylacetoacetate hydrolase family protein [Rhizobium skierniewicense]|uniref:fumarylacetoacetate hydrolase family protein n=1 Tax=Rhizobium skierniewicense TaxID=984260 RepID=UPI00157353F4|nr:fumarylacetoacetate hydrolase family protein [Rhizobium skierniewicense]NTF34227.1 fumarylacetoacetate hydrolase family protein [Rhizobium skierniewicense]